MSRCFCYPPPLYINGTKSSDEVLIELIKLQRASEKAKAERKKEKKQEKRVRKEKEKAKKVDEVIKEDLIQDGNKSPRSVVSSTEFFEREDSDEQMARITDLTAEDSLQLISSVIHEPNYSSSDNSTAGSSNKRRKIRPSSGMITGDHGNENKLSASSPFEKELQRLNLLYKELIGCWVPPATPLKELAHDIVDDQEWLFGVQKHQDDRQAKKFKPSSDLSSCRGNGSSTLCPRAQYLPEADIYALPYTLPF